MWPQGAPQGPDRRLWGCGWRDETARSSAPPTRPDRRASQNHYAARRCPPKTALSLIWCLQQALILSFAKLATPFDQLQALLIAVTVLTGAWPPMLCAARPSAMQTRLPCFPTVGNHCIGARRRTWRYSCRLASALRRDLVTLSSSAAMPSWTPRGVAKWQLAGWSYRRPSSS